jgi:hypothetical protein
MTTATASERLDRAREAAVQSLEAYLSELHQEAREVESVRARLVSTNGVVGPDVPAAVQAGMTLGLTRAVMGVMPNKANAQTVADIKRTLEASGFKTNSVGPTLSALVQRGTVKRLGTSLRYRYYTK